MKPLARRKKHSDAIIQSPSEQKKTAGEAAEREVAAMTDEEVRAFLAMNESGAGQVKLTDARGKVRSARSRPATTW